jgi:8-oxo-dGTP pyrophosphatase MutT (NUDIX family)
MFEAAVALVRIASADPEILILRRAHHPQDPWSGHFALPGGRRDPTDADALATCRRETLEECGIHLDETQWKSALEITQAGNAIARPMRVQPHLFELPERPAIVLDTREIASYHWVPESYLRDKVNHAFRACLPELPERLFPGIPVSDGVIWGFTYRVLEKALGWKK